MKECDKQAFKKPKKSVIPALIVPVKYLYTTSMGTVDKTSKESKSEIKHSIMDTTLEKKEIILDRAIEQVSYLGILYPSGRIRLKKIRIMGRGERCYDFYCYSQLDTKKDQEKLALYERMLNEQEDKSEE